MLSGNTLSQEQGHIKYEVIGDIISWIYYPYSGAMETNRIVVDYMNAEKDKGLGYKYEYTDEYSDVGFSYEGVVKPTSNLVWDREKLHKGKWRIYIYAGTRDKKRLLAKSGVFEIK